MVSRLFGFITSTPSQSAVRYGSITSADHGIASTTNAAIASPMPGAFTLSNFYVSLGASPGSGKSWTFIIVKNGSDTALSITITDSAVTGSDDTNTASFSAGDTIAIKSSPTSTPGAPSGIRWNILTTGTGQPITIYSNSSHSTVDVYTPMTGSGGSVSTTANLNKFVMPTAGTLSNLYAITSVAPGAGTSKILTIVQNNVASSLVATIADTNTTANDTTHTINVLAGDSIGMAQTHSGSVSTGNEFFGFVFTPTNDGESIIGFSTNGSPSTSVVNYDTIAGTKGFTATEANIVALTGSGTLKKFYGRTSTASGAGTSYDITVRLNSASSALTVNCANTTTAQSVTTDVAVTSTDTLGLAWTPNSTPTSGRMNAGALMVFDSPVTTLNYSVNDSATLADSSTSYSDTIFTREQISVQITASTDLNISLSDTLTSSESTSLQESSFVNVSDSLTLSESVNRLLTSNVSVSDSVTFTETSTLLIPSLFINVSDSLTITESSSVLNIAAGNIGVTQNLVISEVVTLLIPTLFITTSDSLTTSEAIQLNGQMFINKSDSLTITESRSLQESIGLSASDSIMLTESQQQVVTPLFINVSETVTFTENILLFNPILFVVVSEILNTSESLNVSIVTLPSVPYRLLNPSHRYTGPRGVVGPYNTRFGPRPTRGPR